MSQTRLTYLLQRYFKDAATPEELDELMPFLEDTENEEAIKTAMEEFWKVHSPTPPVFSAEKSRSMLTGILSDNTHPIALPVKKKVKWLYVAAAVVLLALSSAVFYRFSSIEPGQRNIATSTVTSIDVAPGGYKAVLLLADQSTIVLDKAANGILTQQGNTKIVKHANGQLVYIPSNEAAGETLYNSISTPRGGEYQLVLSDGSKAWLNAASSLRFPAAFGGGERKVEITGEVYFEVANDASRPFIVNVAGKEQIKVLGTHFNINAYDDEASITTTLLEGTIQVTSTVARDFAVISAGQQVELIANGKLNINKNVNTEQVMAWKNRLFDFSEADLLTILRQLSRWYDVDIAFEGAVPQKRFAGELQRDLNLSQVLRLLEKNNVHFKIEGKKLLVLDQ